MFFNSVENQCNVQGLRFKDDAVSWFDLRIPIMRDPRDVDGYQAEALTRPVKYPRIVRRELNGRERWYVQLVLEGLAPERRLTGVGAVGLDIGPSTIAMVSDSDAALESFCPTVRLLASCPHSNANESRHHHLKQQIPRPLLW